MEARLVLAVVLAALVVVEGFAFSTAPVNVDFSELGPQRALNALEIKAIARAGDDLSLFLPGNAREPK